MELHDRASRPRRGRSSTTCRRVPGLDGTTATVQWGTERARDLARGVRDERPTPGHEYGLGLDAYVTAHSVALSGLSANTTYYYRVTSADASGNADGSRASRASSRRGELHGHDGGRLLGGDARRGRRRPADRRRRGGARGGSGLDGVRRVPGRLDERRVGRGWQPRPIVSGQLVVDGARANTQSGVTYGPGHVGRVPGHVHGAGRSRTWASGAGTTSRAKSGCSPMAPWAMFSTASDGDEAVRAGLGPADVALDSGAAGLGAHLPDRLDGDGVRVHAWTASSVTPQPTPIAEAMRWGRATPTPGGAQLSVDWVHVFPVRVGGHVRLPRLRRRGDDELGSPVVDGGHAGGHDARR